MKRIGRILHLLSVRIVVSIVVFVTLLAVLVGIISYQVFTKTMIKEVSDHSRETVSHIRHYVAVWPLEDYLVMGASKMYEYRGQELSADDADDFEQAHLINTAKAYDNTIMNLTIFFREEGVEEMALIIPDRPTGYSKATVIFWAKKSEEPEKYDDQYVTLGYIVDIEDQGARDALKRIWEEGSDEEVTINYNRGDGKDAVLTVFMPTVDDEDDQPDGVLFMVRSVQKVVDTWERYLIGLTVTWGVVILVGILLMAMYIRNKVGRPVAVIVAEAERFAKENVKGEGDLSENVGKITEMRVLAEAIDKMEEDTVSNMAKIEQMSRESERIDTELTLAAELQASVLPKGDVLSDRKEFHVSARMEPAREVGGDFYDFFLIDDTHLALLIADVSDKGMGAAFFMAMSKSLLKARANMGGSPAEIITFVEERLSEGNDAGMFVTVWLGIVDLATGEVTACNAGHNFPAILQQETGEGYRIEKTEHGPPICFLPGMGFAEYSFRLNPGDRIFLYTDGVTEAKNPEGERFENERLMEALNGDRTTGDEDLILRVKAAVEGFAGEEPQYDDITMVSFTFLGTDKSEGTSETDA